MHHHPIIVSAIGARVLHIIKSDQANAPRALATSTELHDFAFRSIQTWVVKLRFFFMFKRGHEEAVYTVFSSNFGH